MVSKAKKKKLPKYEKPFRHLTTIEFRAIAFVTTLILAGIAIVLDVNEPVVWGFLSTAIGISLGQAIQFSRN